jgi:predicted RNase H-like HicB family nuclease
MKPKGRYTISDGKLVLCLEPAEEGGYVVTSPLDPELITEAETVEEAFLNARDAAKALKESRVKMLRQLAPSAVQGVLPASVHSDKKSACRRE